MIKVAVADDQALLRSGLKMILTSEPDIEVVGEAANGREVLAVVARTHPDVVVDGCAHARDGWTRSHT